MKLPWIEIRFGSGDAGVNPETLRPYLRALMAAWIASGHRASESSERFAPMPNETLAQAALEDADAILARIESSPSGEQGGGA